MNSHNCNDRECNQGNCPFMTDPFDSYRQVCVKCGKDYSFRKYRFNTFLLLGMLIACILLLTNNRFQPTQSQSESQPFSQELPSKP